jgi:hypothetical protein
MTLDGVARLALSLPEAIETEHHGHRTWSVNGKGFAWERPFSKADIKRFGDVSPPHGPIIATRVADLSEKEAVLAANSTAFFTIPHFDGYSAVLIQLNKVTKQAVHDAIVDGWLTCAPAALVDQYLSG